MTVQSIRDFFWVLWTFIRGKMLRQKAYIPSPTNYSFVDLLELSGKNEKRFAMLMRFWGPHELEDGDIRCLELMAASQHPAYGHIPFWFQYDCKQKKYLGVTDPAWVEFRRSFRFFVERA